ncbi:tRNA lysidine(34) synthetase TilS [Alteriqipengyuania flavescens]|uniref:tRNA lysidine(34) synthetase TilS n=1 Tax=Alteriqipengyuania flavescens TaxID=3053610 RepID=UPI0025B32416|nr:tRNA lysidine(34) synthetase TilS [Alteriqipengyuania flavescens]WJY17571.1 tRNA lysidine(34) synthetase TilS [Alteriqipengyuania flavescens]WJY23514.1 tRNA lysidine(34) synthetase TilS [Alteriqipengyuania flavescens]
MTGGAIDGALLGRFADGLRGVWNEGARLGLAVSGGADSMALLRLAHASDIDIGVATVDHGLRPEAAGECRFVAAACEALGIACTVLEVEVAGGNRQEQARIARYRALGDWARRAGVSAIATAHHADDQAETLLMRLNRGSGLAGLAGIRPRTVMEGLSVPVVRPLLAFRRAELRDVLRQAGQDHIEDPSNTDMSFERVRMRQVLGAADWLDPVAMARSAAYLAEAEATLQAIAEVELAEAEGKIGLAWTAHAELNARALDRAIAKLGGAPAPGDTRQLALRLADGGKGNLAGVLVEVKGDRATCRPEPARRSSGQSKGRS